MRAGGALPLFIINLQIKEALQSKEAFHVVKVLCLLLHKTSKPIVFWRKDKKERSKCIFCACAVWNNGVMANLVEVENRCGRWMRNLRSPIRGLIVQETQSRGGGGGGGGGGGVGQVLIRWVDASCKSYFIHSAARSHFRGLMYHAKGRDYMTGPRGSTTCIMKCWQCAPFFFFALIPKKGTLSQQFVMHVVPPLDWA